MSGKTYDEIACDLRDRVFGPLQARATEAEKQARDERRARRDIEKHLTELVVAAEVAVKALDEEMAKPVSTERGKRVAAIANRLEMAKDMAIRFGLRRGE
jgi:predicted  nucleic acid-binding Zn-ribbon protein